MKNFNRTAISWHSLSYSGCTHFPKPRFSFQFLKKVTFFQANDTKPLMTKLVETEFVHRTGSYRCVGQMQVTFRLNGRISDHFVELKRIKGILTIMTRYFSVGYRTFSVTNNFRKGKDLLTTLMFDPLPITWKAAYVNLRSELC